MEALILAAGSGMRLKQQLPKCLSLVGGRCLLHHQLDAVTEAGADRITLVLGYEHELVEQAAEGRAAIILNERYAVTNSLYSFWLARDSVHDDVLILNSDVLFDPAVLGHVLSVDGSALAYDSSSGDEDEHMKIRTRRGVLLRVSKALPPAYSHGENLGLVHLEAAAARAAFAAADRRVHRGGDKEWVGAAFTDIARQHSIACVDVAGQPWVEIDFPEDLDSARRRVWPAIHASVLQRRTQATLASPQASATSREVAT